MPSSEGIIRCSHEGLCYLLLEKGKYYFTRIGTLIDTEYT